MFRAEDFAALSGTGEACLVAAVSGGDVAPAVAVAVTERHRGVAGQLIHLT